MSDTQMQTPGVYIHEVPAGARPIQAVGTSTAGFVGYAPDPDVAPSKQAQQIVNPTQFQTLFNPGRQPENYLSRAVTGFFQNGGRLCFVVNLGKEADKAPLVADHDARAGLALLEETDDVAIVAAPGFTDAASQEALLSHCERLKTRVAILDPPVDVTDLLRLRNFDAAVPPPPPKKSPGGGDDGDNAAHPVAAPPADRAFVRKSDYGAAYFPWLLVPDWGTKGHPEVPVPPSGHLAGVWARTDATRGVHKAPANEPIRGVINLSYRVVDAEQDTLNAIGINCIRTFSTEGIKVWGARTLFSDPEWKYLSVRRLFIMIEESIRIGTRWVVFEPNDRTLWKSICRDVSAFLTNLWRSGALMGRTPAEAFFVKCDEETNPQEVIDAGQVVIMVGIAPVKPAEFVVFNISQADGAATSSLGGVTSV
jgi:phage tail sheath protein FI